MLKRHAPFVRAAMAGVLLLVLPSAARAQGATSDLSNATCANFLTLPAKDKEQLTLWLSGFFAGQASRPRISPQVMATLPEAMGALCSKTPEAMLIGAEMRALFQPPQAP